MSFAEDRAAEQYARAERVAIELTGARQPSRNIIRAVLALVVADERTDIPRAKSSGPDPGARQILRSASAPKQEALW